MGAPRIGPGPDGSNRRERRPAHGARKPKPRVLALIAAPPDWELPWLFNVATVAQVVRPLWEGMRHGEF